MKTLITCLSTTVAAALVASSAVAAPPPAPILPTPAPAYESGPSLQLPPPIQSFERDPLDRPTLELPPSYTPQSSFPDRTAQRPVYPTPQPYHYQPESHVGSNHVPPSPVAPSPAVISQPGFGPIAHGPVVGGGPIIGGGPYVSPPTALVPGPTYPIPVRYEDRDNIHPFSVRQTLFVPSPCGGGQIGIDVCAPPGCPVLKVKRGGRKIEYDYGDYEVDFIFKKDKIIVDYDD